jgi:glycosyltransferase involved in cell wall biosynthesis
MEHGRDQPMTGSILHLIGQMRRGGAERQLLHLAGALQARGWRQAVVSFHAGDAWTSRWAECGIRLYEIAGHPFKPWRLWQLARVVHRERPAILHAWSPHVAEYARWAWGKGGAKTLYGLRIDATVDKETGEPVGRLGRMAALSNADCAVSNSRSAVDRLVERGVRLPRTEVIYNIVVPHGHARPAELAAVPRIVAVGSLIPRKGYDCLIQAAAILAGQGKQFEVLLAGEGPERSRLERLSSALKLTGSVQFLGAIDHVPDLLAGAHVLAHPSKREGLSNTILEAMAERVPVVSTWECAAEIIDDGRTGLLVPAGKPAELAAAICRLLDTSELRNQIANAALQHVERHCNIETITQQYERVYQSLLTDAVIASDGHRFAHNP